MAVFCYFDGAELRPVAGRLLPHQLPHDFVFPSGRKCNTYDDLSEACQQQWEEARGLLRRGVFTLFMTNIGRLDLARAANEATEQPNDDAALSEFLGRLPTRAEKGPRLDLSPRRLDLGKLRPGESRRIKLAIGNTGGGLLRGTLTVDEAVPWLRLIEGGQQCQVMTAREQLVSLWVETAGLPAPASYNAKLTVVTNGGIVAVPVGFDLKAHAFPKAPFQGADSPRDIAERMRVQPKAAVPLLESGEIAAWFETNNWTYPVQGVPARGVAAVQQFFEGMGLSKPPPLALSQDEVRITCLVNEMVPGQIAIDTAARKWVYASAESDQSWLKVTTPSVSGARQAVVGFEVDSGLMDEGQVHYGAIHITANAGQLLTVRIIVDVRRPHEPFTRRLLRPFFTSILS
jgi:hypothetical protein